MKVRASAERLASAVESLSARLVEKMGAEAFKRHFPELAEVMGEGSGSSGGSVERCGGYNGSGRFGFNGEL